MRAPVLAAVTVLPLLLLLALTEGVVVGPEPPTYAPASDNVNCNDSIKLLPVLRLVIPASTTASTTTTAFTASQPQTSDPYALPPPTTTTNTIHPQPHGTPVPTTTPALPITTSSKPTLRPKKQHTIFDRKPKATKPPQTTQHPKEHHTHKFDKTVDKLKLDSYFAETSSSSSSSSSSTLPPEPSSHVTIPLPDSPPHTSTLPPLSPTLPLPTAPPPVSATTPMSLLTLQQLGERLRQLVAKRLPLALTSGWAKEFQRPYLERIRAVNHEIVDKVLQANYDEYGDNSTTSATTTPTNNTNACHLPEKRLAPLFHQQTLLLLLLQALPQSLQEMEEAIWDSEITDYIFRPEKKAVFDVYSCRECYALDASGVCREMFFCKDGEDMFSSTRRRQYG